MLSCEFLNTIPLKCCLFFRFNKLIIMLLKAIPLMMIILPIIGFFFTPEPASGDNALADLAFFLFTIPWWGKLISIFVGMVWLLGGSSSEEEKG